MALPQYTTADLIANIKRRCSVPTSQLTYTNEDFSLLANDTLQGEVVPLLMSTREEYFIAYVDLPLPADGVIAIPSGTVGSKVRSVCYLQSSTPLSIVNVPRLDLDVIAGIGPASRNGSIAGFCIQNNNLHFYSYLGIPSGSTIRIYYYKRTLALAQPSKYGRITSINAGTSTIVLDALPSDWATGTVLNTVSSTPGFSTTNELATIVTVSSPSIVLDTVAGMAVGDYISDYGYSAIPQIPIEAHQYLAQLTAAKCLEGLGDREAMASALKKADVLEQGLLIIISQRVDGSVKKLVNPNGGLRYRAGLR